MEAGLWECLCDCFTLTHDTPPLQEPLRSELDLLGTTEAAQQILEGTYECPEGVDEFTRDFLSVLCHPHNEIPEFSCEISRKDFQQYWHRAQERTSSSFSGLHFGHYKAASHDNFLSDMHSYSTQFAFEY